MLKSMTGFGSAAAENEEYKAEVELKAVNQRFLEIGFHMDHALDFWETEMRKTIQSVAAREKSMSLSALRTSGEAGERSKWIAIAHWPSGRP